VPAVLVDSGPLIALFDRSDRHHAEAVAFVRKHRGPMITNVAVMTEVCHLLDFSTEAQRDFLAWAEQALELDGETPRDLGRIREIVVKYASLPADFADASLVALAERRGLFVVASVDSDFTVYRGAAQRRFRNVFFGT
jgi:predicted nucleic acid-binding protein